MSTATPPARHLQLVVGYDGSPPAVRAIGAAARMLQDRTGRIDVVYVAHLSSTVMLSPAAIAEMDADFDEIERDLRAGVAERMRGRGEDWQFQRRQGLIPEELIATARDIRDADPDAMVVIVVGSSSHAAHRVVGSVAVNLARHAPVPLIVVP
jgi:nucleotide-binding universal stress UspA family protein